MASVLALVSKGVFEKQFGKNTAVGDLLQIDVYNSKHRGLQTLSEGGDLYLVTVRPDDVLWLVGILRNPTFDETRWTAPTNVVAVTNAAELVDKLVFSTGKGITADPGKLGMSLQTPRKLTDDDVALFESLVGEPPPDAPARDPLHNYDAQLECNTRGERDDHDLRTGEWLYTRPDGSTKWKKQFQCGLMDGTQLGYHPNGDLAVHGEIRGGRWVRLSYNNRADTDIHWLADIGDGVARVEWFGDDLGWWVRQHYFDGEGSAVDQTGQPLPKRPAEVPDDAIFVRGEQENHWRDGAFEQGTLNPVGVHRLFNEAGDLLETLRHDSAGRLRSKASALGGDSRREALDAFLNADQYEFQPAYDLIKAWDPQVHQEIVEWLPKASIEAVASYLEALGERSWLYTYTTREGKISFDQLRLEFIDSWRALNPSPQNCDALQQINELDTELRDALTSGLGAELQIIGLRTLLRNKRGAALASDPTGKAWFVDEEGAVTAAPVQIDESRRSFACHMQDADRLDERVLFWSGSSVWWTMYRFGTSLFLQGSKYFTDRGQAEIILDLFVRCPDWDCTQQISKLFKSTKPGGAKSVDAHFLEHKGWGFAYGYEAMGESEIFGRNFSRLAHEGKLFSAGGSPGLLQLYMLEQKEGKAPKLLAEFESRELAVAAMERDELTAMRVGYGLRRVSNLPLVAVEEPDKPQPQKQSADMIDVADDVSETLHAALEALASGDLAAAINKTRDAWTRRPLTAVADALDDLSHSAPGLHDIGGRQKQAIAAWTAVEQQRNPEQFGPLTTSLADATTKEVASRIDRLVAWPEDPRLDAALARIARQVPWTSSGSQTVWRRIFNRLEGSRDARVLSVLRSLEGHYQVVWDSQAGEWARDRVAKLLAARAATLEALAALEPTSAETAALKQLVAAQNQVLQDDPLATVFANPLDDEERLKLPGLVEGPRADVIALQAKSKLSPQERSALKELLKEHRAELAGPLTGVMKKPMQFRLGFMSECTLLSEVTIPPDVLASPYWATVETLDVNERWEFLEGLSLPSIREIRGLATRWDAESPQDWLVFADQLGDASQRLEALDAKVGSWSEVLALAAILPAKLPSLRRLEIRVRDPDELHSLPPEFHQLESLILATSGGQSQQILDEHGEWVVRWDHAIADTFAELFNEGHDLDLGLDLQVNDYFAPLRFRFERRNGAYHLSASGSLNDSWFETVVVQTCALLSKVDPTRCPSASLRCKAPDVDHVVERVGRVAGRAGIAVDFSAVKPA